MIGTDINNNLFDVFSYETHYANGVSVVMDGENMVYMSESDNEYIKQVFPPSPNMVATQTTYFADTLTVRGEGRFLKGWDIEIGIWKEYNRDGELINEINKDEHYPISWEEMQKRFLANGIHVDDIKTLRRSHDTSEGNYLWVLTLKSPRGILDIAYFDAATGELIERKQIPIRMDRA
jgi:hypothetical protein